MEILATALLMGLLGSGHCAAMCGSLTIAAGFAIPPHRSFLISAILMSVGRILGYAFIGLIANLISQSIVSMTQGGVLYLSFLSGLLLFAVGLHIANINNWILKTEKLGAYLQPKLQPLKKALTPIDSHGKCLSYGVLWGFLPCGLVYTALSLALVASTPVEAGLIMIFFGIGTLPMLVGLTRFSSQLNQIVKKNWVRRVLGFVVMAMAMYHLIIATNKISHLS